MNDWMEEIAALDREPAREKFEDWCRMLADTHDPLRFVRRRDDIARLHIETAENYVARDLSDEYGGRRCPIRCLDINAVGPNSVELVMLLADLELHNPRADAIT